MDTFVNPLPGMSIFKILGFDFPAHRDYHATGCPSNLNPPKGGPEAPGVEDIYGPLGYPRREQGFPLMREAVPEAEDPRYHDQIVDKDREWLIFHTGRLSGSFVQYLIQSNHKSKIKIHAHPLDNDNPTVLLFELEIPLVPGANAPNTWFWLNPDTRSELLCTIRTAIPKDWNGMVPGIYKLVVNWEFWDYKDAQTKVRMPMSGFCSAISFELTPGTVTL